jgi:predicted TIM-barrel fold metal-dependent hydrolase
MKGLVYDVDVHNQWASQLELVEYLPSRWQPFFHASGAFRSAEVPVLTWSRPGGTTHRLDASPPDGGTAGSSYGLLREQLLDRYSIDRALLTFPVGAEPALRNGDLAVAMCTAANDWMIDRWLAADQRLFAAAMIPTHAPVEAAKEIRRVAGHPQVSGILVSSNPLGKPFGNVVYDPIYDAIVETGLPLVLHIGGDLRATGTANASGVTLTRADQFALTEQPAVHHLVSLIAGGVFEKFPGLRVLFNECGFSWIPSVFWTLDAHYDILKIESPGLRRLPSEYLREHVWMSSQPFDVAEPRMLLELMEAFGGLEDRICFSSDYPHHDSESPNQVASRVPREWRSRILCDNAAGVLGWPTSMAAAA